MEILENQEALQTAIQKHPIVVMQFGAESCAPCKALQNRIKEWNRTHPAVYCLYGNTADFPELCARMGIFTVPSILVYAEGKLTLRQSGYFSLDQMLRQIEKYQRLLEI